MFLALLLLAGMMLLFPSLAREAWWARAAAVAVLEWACLRYLVFRWCDTFPHDLVSGIGLFQFVFLVAETIALGHTCLTGIVLLRHRDRRPDADRCEAALRQQGDHPTVDILVPTYSEPEPVLRKTIEGCLLVDWPKDRLTITFLDDGNRDWLRDLCARSGVGYLRRPDRGRGGKAGNLNYGLLRTTGAYICCLDADFIPSPRILTRLVALCRSEPDIGIVQTPQHFDNPDPVQWNLAGDKAWTEEQRFFCDVVEPARDAWDATFCIGTGWVARRAAIDAIGGTVPEDTVCEDMYTSYVMRAKGFRTIYLNEALAFGLAAESIGEYIAQRVRWCQGTVQTLYVPFGMLRHPTLDWIGRIMYLDLLWYWSGFTFLILLAAAPAIYWFAGVPVFYADIGDTASAVLPRIAGALFITWWLSGGKVMPLATDVKKWVLIFHVVPAFWQAVWSPERLTFRVTAKGQAFDRAVVQWRIMWPFAAILVLNGVGLAFNLSATTQVVEWDQYMVMNLLLSLYGLIVAFLCCLACVDRPKTAGYWQRSQTLEGGLPATVRALLGRWLR